MIAKGCSVGDSRAAVWRFRGDYYTAAVIEQYYGERRRFGEQGQTMHEAFDPPQGEFDKRCRQGFQEDWEALA